MENEMEFLEEIYPKLFVIKEGIIYLVTEEFGTEPLTSIFDNENNDTFILRHASDFIIFYFGLRTNGAIFDVMLKAPSEVSNEFYHILFEYEFIFPPYVEEYIRIEKRQWAINQINNT